MVEENAAVSMIPRIFRAANSEGDHEVGDSKIFDQRDMTRASNFGFVVAVTTVDAKHGVAIHLAMRPTLFIRDFPALSPLFEVFRKDERQTMQGLGRVLLWGLGFVGLSNRDERKRDTDSGKIRTLHGKTQCL